jgi:hypothetical protein
MALLKERTRMTHVLEHRIADDDVRGMVRQGKPIFLADVKRQAIGGKRLLSLLNCSPVNIHSYYPGGSFPQVLPADRPVAASQVENHAILDRYPVRSCGRQDLPDLTRPEDVIFLPIRHRLPHGR